MGNTKDIEVKIPLKGVHSVSTTTVSQQLPGFAQGQSHPAREQALPGQPTGVSAHSRCVREQPLAPVLSIYS